MRLLSHPKANLLIMLFAIFGILLLTKQSANPEQPIPLPLPPEGTAEVVVNTEPFEPSHFGIPDTIAGYKVLAVITSENTACVPQGTTRLVVQALDSTMEEYLANEASQNLSQDIYQAALQLGITQPEFNIVGPGGNLSDIVINTQLWNQGMQNGCIVLGRPSNPDDEN